MIVFKFIKLAIIAAVLSLSISAKAPDIKIVVERTSETVSTIQVTFEGEGDGTTDIRLPNEWGGHSDLYKAVRIVSVSPSSAKITDSKEPFIRTIIHEPRAKLTVTYELTQDFAGPLKTATNYRPVTDKDYLHWIGHTVWVLPQSPENSNANFSLEWKGFPNEWMLANSFGVGERKQKFVISPDEFRTAIFVAGDFRLSRTSVNGKPVDIAIRGKWQFMDAELAESIRRVVETQRNFWNDHSQNKYLVTLVPLDEDPNASSFGGTGLTDSFALFATTNATVDGVRGLLAHEYAHNWIAQKLGQMPKVEQQLYWFSEGFTEFYTYRLLLRSGQITLPEFVTAYNDRLREYYMSPVRTAPNERIVKDFWTDRNVQRLPYLRGFLFATNLNSDIQKYSAGKRSLDDVMLEMFAAAKAAPQMLSFESLASSFSKYLGRDAGTRMKSFLTDGDLIAPNADSLGAKVAMQITQVGRFDIGFDFDKFSKERVVADVDPISAAYAAGLRNGQKRASGVSVWFGDTTREIEFRVSDKSGEKLIKYFPVTAEKISIPQFAIK